MDLVFPAQTAQYTNYRLASGVLRNHMADNKSMEKTAQLNFGIIICNMNLDIGLKQYDSNGKRGELIA